MINVVSIDSKQQKVPEEFKTPPAIAKALKEALEKMIEAGVIAGMVSGETFAHETYYEMVPASAAFARGHIYDLRDYVEDEIRARAKDVEDD